MPPITASLLYALVECPHRVWLDAYEDPVKRDPVSPFVELLWERGSKFEQETIRRLKLPFTDLSAISPGQREQETLLAMQRGDQLIYGGRISTADLVGQPDLLRREGLGYVAGDIKSGAGEEGADEDNRKPKRHYAVQLALYTDILSQLGLSAGRRAFVWDIHGAEVAYDFDNSRGSKNPQTLWSFYEHTLGVGRRILSGHEKTLPAAASVCKLCHWNSACREAVRGSDDLSQIPELGRKRRDAMMQDIPTVADLAAINPEGYIKKNKTPFAGVGPSMLRKFCDRARLLKSNGKPYLTQPASLPLSERELHFDLEADPLRDHIYLHGFVVRDRGLPDSKYISFVAEQPTQDAERQAFAQAIDFFRASPSAIVYVYSAYERTTYRKLQEKYPDVVTGEQIERLFESARTVDLYGIVRSSTEWPTWDFSIKTLAKFLGFTWRDINPSGAASIEWYDRFVETGGRALLQRILDYNEDDCRAMIVLLDAIRAMA
jgi:predicted RecB family nuclease